MENHYGNINNPFKDAVNEIEGIIMQLKQSDREYDIPEVRKVLEQLLNGRIESPVEAVQMAEDIARPPLEPDSEQVM